MELSDFKTFDPRSIKGFSAESLKKITIEDIKFLIMAKKWEFLAVIFALIGIIGSLQFYSFNANRVAELNSKLSLLQNREEPIVGFKKTIKDAQELFASLPKGLDETEFIPAVTDIAKKYSIRIMDFSPPMRKELQYYTVTSSSISCITSDFKSLFKFIHGLENEEYAMSIDSLSITFASGTTKLGFEQEEPAAGNFNVTLSISSIVITVEPPQKR